MRTPRSERLCNTSAQVQKCAAVFPYFSPIFVRTGLVKISFRPSANGPQDSGWQLYFCKYSLATFYCWKTWVSIWFTAGFTVAKCWMSK